MDKPQIFHKVTNKKIKAIQFTGKNTEACLDFCWCAEPIEFNGDKLALLSYDKYVLVDVGDYIIERPEGSLFYVETETAFTNMWRDN